MAFAALLGILLLVLLAGVPIAYAIGGLAVIGNQWFGATSFTRLAETQFSSINSFVVMAIPFFILAGNVMLEGKMARSLFDFMSALTRWMTGGAAIGATGACALFGALTGSSAAAAAALSPVVVPELTRLGYPRPFACGLMAAGGTLGIMIPPSVVFVVYGALTSTSVASLFLAGVIPGLVRAALSLRRAAAVSPERSVAHLQGRGAVALHAGDRARRHLYRPVHADRGGRGQRRLRHPRHAIRVPDPALERPAARRHRLGEELGGRPHHPRRLARHRPPGVVPRRGRAAGGRADGDEPERVAVPPRGQRHPADPRLLLRRLHPARAADAAAPADAARARHQPDPLLHHPHREHRDRLDHAASGLQPVRDQQHHQGQAHRSGARCRAVRRRDDRRHDADHLRPCHLAGVLLTPG